MKKMVLLKLSDGEFEHEQLIITSLSEKEIQGIIDKTIEKWEKEGFKDWSYLDLIEELEERGIIETIGCEYYDIYA